VPGTKFIDKILSTKKMTDTVLVCGVLRRKCAQIPEKFRNWNKKLIDETGKIEVNHTESK
jgi:hypothetical protein